MNLLVDTNILIDYLRGDKTVKKIFISSKIKVYYSILTKKELLQHKGLTTRDKKIIRDLLASLRPIRIDPQISSAASTLLDTYKKKNLSIPDAIIAATAWAKKMPLVTRNVKHFRFIREIQMNTLTRRFDD